MKALSILIPTYNRADILPNAIKSISIQIESFNLQNDIDILVCNDFSPDDTKDYLDTLSKEYINVIHRPHNFGMSANIYFALRETCKSEWVLILTDDDTLESDILPTILEKCQELSASNVSICLTPRYSYLANGELHCIICESFDRDMLVYPSPLAAGQLMGDGFILSGILLQPHRVDYSLWEKNIENAFFPVILTGSTLRSQYGYYWSKKIVNHTVLNECFWDRWGKTEIERSYRLFYDFIHSYSILADDYNRSHRDVHQFLVGAKKKLVDVYYQYLFCQKEGLQGLTKVYGVHQASQMVRDTIFNSFCSRAIFLSFLLCTKSSTKHLLKSVLLFRKPNLINCSTIWATVLAVSPYR
jgi:glycosyltransferase involved in cell wall biosynthesis